MRAFALAPLILGLAWALITGVQELAQRTLSGARALPAVVLGPLALFALYWVIRTYGGRLSTPRRFVAALVIAMSIVGGFTIATIDTEYTSDFARLDYVASVAAERGPGYFAEHLALARDPDREAQLAQRFEGVEPKYHRYLALYADRVLLYAYPVYLVFGRSRAALEGFNLVLHVLAALLLYGAIRRSDERLARGAAVWFAIFPATYVRLNYPNHDVPGLFFLALYFFATSALFAERPRWAGVPWSILAGGALLATDLQRGYGPLLVLTAVIVGLARPRRFHVLAALPIAILLFGRPLVSVDQSPGRLPEFLFAFNDASQSGTYPEGRRYLEQYATQLRSDEERWDYALGRLGTEITQRPAALLGMFGRKTETMQALGRDGYWAFRTKTPTSKRTQAFALTLDVVVRVLLLAMALLGAMDLARRREPIPRAAIAVLAFWTLLAGASLVSQVQPRYGEPLLFAAAFLAAWAMTGFAPRRARWPWRPVLLFVTLGVGVAWIGGVALRDRVFVELPNATVTGSGERSWPLPGRCGTLRGFLRTEGDDARVELRAGGPIVRTHLPDPDGVALDGRDDRVQFVRQDVEASELALTLTSSGAATAHLEYVQWRAKRCVY